jgi:ABC-type transport system involved in multi-copper enzyme maturation permease subunit
VTTLTMVTTSTEDAILRPLPWRRMSWVTWRQHRVALTSVTTLFGALTLSMIIAGLRLHHAYAMAVACHPAGSLLCSTLVNDFNGTNGYLANGLILQVVPALVGAFIGAPVLAREMESGTFRFAWTQGFGRWRWAIAKVVSLAVFLVVTSAALGALFSWYYGSYFTVNRAFTLSKAGVVDGNPFAPGLFDLHVVTFAAWTLAAFALGVLAGIIIRRVVPAIVTTLAVYGALALAVGAFLREHYLKPLTTSNENLSSSAWIIRQFWVRHGHPVSQGLINRLLTNAPASAYAKGGTTKSFDTARYFAQHGISQSTTYQPASRFMTFQWIEGGWLLVLSVVLISFSVWIVGRRAV